MALFQDFPVGDWARKACATEFWKGKSTSIPILKCFPTSFTALNGEIAQNMHESKVLPIGQSHVTKSQLLLHPPPSTTPEGEVWLNIDRRINSTRSPTVNIFIYYLLFIIYYLLFIIYYYSSIRLTGGRLSFRQ